jgi:hypothetical protein
MSEPPADDLTKRLFVCCGYVTLESGKPGIAIAEVMPEPVSPSDETASQFHIPGTGDLVRGGWRLRSEFWRTSGCRK